MNHNIGQFYLNHLFHFFKIFFILDNTFDQMASIRPGAIIINIFIYHLIRKIELLFIILDMVNNPNPITPSMIIFILNFQHLINQVILFLVLSSFLWYEPPVFPYLKILYFFFQNQRTIHILMLVWYWPAHQTHFFHIPAIVVSFSKWDNLFSKSISLFIEYLMLHSNL